MLASSEGKEEKKKEVQVEKEKRKMDRKLKKKHREEEPKQKAEEKAKKTAEIEAAKAKKQLGPKRMQQRLLLVKLPLAPSSTAQQTNGRHKRRLGVK